jgi:RNA polymerase primary sigma factor
LYGIAKQRLIKPINYSRVFGVSQRHRFPESSLLSAKRQSKLRELSKISFVNSQSKSLLEQPRVHELIERGARAGRLSYEEINDLLGDLSLDDIAAEELFEALEERAIAVVDEPRPAMPKSKAIKPARRPKAEAKNAGETAPNAKASANAEANSDLDDVLASLESLEGIMATRLDNWEEVLAEGAPAATLEDEDFDSQPVEDAYRQYMHRMAQFERISPEEENRLARLAKYGSPAEQEDARRQLVESNWRLVVFMARKYGDRTTLPLLDIVQEGMVGLVRAVERFDPDRGQRLSTYATWWIRQSINRAIADQARSMRLPGHIYSVMQKIRRVQSELSQGLGRSPSRLEIAEAAGMPLSLVEEAMRASMQPLSLDSPVGDDEEMELSDIIGDDEDEGEIRVTRGELRAGIEQALEGISDRERVVISKRFGIGDYAGSGPQTLDDIALELKISRERVRQLEIRALRKLRRRTRGTPLADAFGNE